MSMLLSYVKSFARNEEGQDLLEYALLVALIALVAIGAVGLAGQSVDSIFSNIAGQLANAA
jgi:pilus assembly protein Flp/PilA